MIYLSYTCYFIAALVAVKALWELYKMFRKSL